MPVEKIWAKVVKLPVAWTPKLVLREPEKELEPVPDPVRLPERVVFPLLAKVKRAVFALLMICKDSEAAPKLLVERIVNLC